LSVQATQRKTKEKTMNAATLTREYTPAKLAALLIAKLGNDRAAEYGSEPTAPYVSELGLERGVDKPGRKYRARISYSSALSGKFTRLTLGSFDYADDAAEAYRMAHAFLYGKLSYADFGGFAG
jgi:hypothetical protein